MEKKDYFVLGMGPAGLFAARMLYLSGHSVIGIGRAGEVGLHSDCLTPRVAGDIEELKRVLQEYEDSNIETIIASDYFISLINESKEANEIYSKLNISEAVWNTYRIVNNKGELDRFCKESNIAVPHQYCWSDITNETVFPVLCKMKIKGEGNKTVGKLHKLESYEAFVAFQEDLEKEEIKKQDVLLQEYLPGDNGLQYSFGGYFRDGKAVAEIIVNQVKQYPQGVSAMVVEAVPEQISSEIRKKVYALTQRLEYTGFLEIEFKVRSRNKELVLLDINPRPWGWVSILASKYPEFYKVFDMAEEKIEPVAGKVYWKSPLRKIMSIRNPLNVKINKSDIRKNYVDCAYDIRCSYDRKPQTCIIWDTLKKVIKNRD